MGDVGEAGNSQTPLKGVVLCCTSLTQDVRTKLSDTATQMGAIHKLDLTSDVTHLIVGSINTTKYKYVAKERPDIKVLKPEWIEAVRLSWMEGGDTDVNALEEAHRMPTFSGLHICVTGFEELQQRNYISSTVAQQGAEYHGDLTKNVSQLIAAVASGAKYTHAKQWGISIVSLKWLTDSLERGMALNESSYDPFLSVKEQGIGAWRRLPRSRTSLAKRDRASELAADGTEEPGKRKMRRTASVRLEGHSQNLWNDISYGEVVAAPAQESQWDETTVQAADAGQNIGVSELDIMQVLAPAEVVKSIEEPEGLFSGWFVFVHGFDPRKARHLSEVLKQNGASIVQVVTDLDKASKAVFFRSRCLLVPHKSTDGSNAMPDIPAGTTVATEWWVERCLHSKQCLDPSDHALSRPLWDLRIHGFTGLKMCSTGFSGVDLRQVAEAIELAGATYQEKLLPSISVLINGSVPIKKEKAYYATKHGIPVVTADWLWACLKTGRKASIENYRMPLQAFHPKDNVGQPSTKSPAGSERNSSENAPRKDEAQIKRLSNTRKRHATPTLQLQRTRTPPALSNVYHDRAKSDSHHTSEAVDDELPADSSLKKSRPLQEISPNASPRKRQPGPFLEDDSSDDASQDLATDKIPPTDAIDKVASPRQESKCRSMGPAKISADKVPEVKHPARPPEALTADLASLLATRQSSRTDTGSSSLTSKRKHMALGRAVSNMSACSSISATAETGSPYIPSDVLESFADGFLASKEATEPASTQLGYEHPEAEEHRALMAKKLGTVFADETVGRRVASLGTVKDSEILKQGVGGRVKGRHRTTKS